MSMVNDMDWKKILKIVYRIQEKSRITQKKFPRGHQMVLDLFVLDLVKILNRCKSWEKIPLELNWFSIDSKKFSVFVGLLEVLNLTFHFAFASV